MCHVSCVASNLSHVTCHLSPITCQLSLTPTAAATDPTLITPPLCTEAQKDPQPEMISNCKKNVENEKALKTLDVWQYSNMLFDHKCKIHTGIGGFGGLEANSVKMKAF